jgi:hypothetical protein
MSTLPSDCRNRTNPIAALYQLKLLSDWVALTGQCRGGRAIESGETAADEQFAIGWRRWN